MTASNRRRKPCQMIWAAKNSAPSYSSALNDQTMKWAGSAPAYRCILLRPSGPTFCYNAGNAISVYCSSDARLKGVVYSLFEQRWQLGRLRGPDWAAFSSQSGKRADVVERGGEGVGRVVVQGEKRREAGPAPEQVGEAGSAA
ncbi:hypothetical protein HPP92_021656 [Vanilla planifolia]|uniref:Uncharacterized protein n=1 Tax=Vanilla planifolia TaxID=51239 RepID=A0A835UG11_VANPL|nr:hypothetical protein HPP92_021976 [Vanilla planifolia]KAG0463180.1 hypothetical protein HPP92_021656 [Vanilla planifolia]